MDHFQRILFKLLDTKQISIANGFAYFVINSTLFCYFVIHII